MVNYEESKQAGRMPSPFVVSRKRYVELVSISKEVIEFLLAKGVTPIEMCSVRRFCEDMQYSQE